MYNMNQISRIKKYENILSISNKTINNLEKNIQALKELEDDINSLNKYYGSNEWYQDINDDNLELLPKDMNRGVLSEDGIYNMLINHKEIAIEMLELATSILKNN